MSLLIIVLLIAIAAYFLFRKKGSFIAIKDEKLLAGYKEILDTEVAYYQRLNAGDQEKFEKLITEFLQYIRIEGVGIEIADHDRVLIASSAVIPIFGFPD
jgi:Mlc titration factor MtfA (ptsG expression regulator)